jgi:hypothetical protein
MFVFHETGILELCRKLHILLPERCCFIHPEFYYKINCHKGLWGSFILQIIELYLQKLLSCKKGDTI